MSTISGINGAATTASSASSASSLTGGQAMGKEAFLQLLVAQLSNQDPMNPLSGHEFAAQLAQFTSVEQLVNIGETLSNQTANQSLLAQGINSGVAAGLIGKNIQATDNELAWTGSGTVPVRFETASAAAKATITIRNAAGTAVRTIEVTELDKGSHDAFTWDGKNNRGAALPSGTYSFEISATDADGAAVAVTPRVSGTVERVSFGSDGIMLWMNGISVPMSAVTSVEGEKQG